MTTRVPDILVERLVRGELPPAQEEEVRRRLTAEPGGLSRIDALVASDRAILAELPPERVAREVRTRVAEAEVREARLRRRRLLGLAPILVAASTLIVVSVSDPTETVPDVRAKGEDGPRIFVHRHHEAHDELLAEGATARKNDELQLGIDAGGWPHGVLFSVDGRGAVTLHQPATAGGSSMLDTSGGESLLARAYVLDDAPLHETFVLVVADAPLDPASIAAQARARGVPGPFVDRRGQPLTVVRHSLRKAP